MANKSELMIDETPAIRAEAKATGQYGGHQNAEDLIRAHFASLSPELRSGLRLRENPNALAAAKDADAGDEIEVPDGGRLIDWTVRGSDPRRMVLSYVYEAADGSWHHGVQPYNTDEYEAPAESAGDRAMRETALHDARVKTTAADLQADLDARLEKFKAEQQEEIAERFKELTTALTEHLSAISAKDEVKGDEPESEVNPSTRTDDSGQSGAGDAEDAPEPGGDDGDVKYPRTHDGLNELAKQSKKKLPDDWDDSTTADKVEWLRENGVKPEDES